VVVTEVDRGGGTRPLQHDLGVGERRAQRLEHVHGELPDQLGDQFGAAGIDVRAQAVVQLGRQAAALRLLGEHELCGERPVVSVRAGARAARVGFRAGQLVRRRPQRLDRGRELAGRSVGMSAAAPRELAASLREGGNVLLLQGRPVCLGMTATRLALNAELFEKCAKAYVLAVASGGPVHALPWLVRMIANRRLAKDQRRATARFLQGVLPEESKGY